MHRNIFSWSGGLTTTTVDTNSLYLTTSAMLQLASAVATGLNKRYRHIERSVSLLTAAFNTVKNNVLLSKIARSRFLGHPFDSYRTISEADSQLQYVKYKTRIVHTGVSKGSKLSPSLYTT